MLSRKVVQVSLSVTALVLGIVLISNASAFLFKYPATYIKNYDGDTITLSTEIWPGLYNIRNVRVVGVDTPELHGTCDTEKLLAVEAKNYTEMLLQEAEDIVVTVYGVGKYGRPLVSIDYDGEDMAEALIEAGLGKKYDGGTRPDWCEEIT